MIEWVFNLSELIKSSSISSFIVACDINDKGSKKFSTFKSLKKFEFFYNKEKIKNYYEVICTDQKSKLYIDLDLHNVTLSDSHKILQNIRNELESFCLMHCDTSPHFIISESHSETKKSYHLSCDNIYFIDQKQRFLFSEQFHQYLSDDLKGYFDCSVYSKNRCFRLLESSKFGQNRPLVPHINSSAKLCDHAVFIGKFPTGMTEIKFDKIEYRNDIKITNTSDNIENLLQSIDIKYWTNRTSWVQLACGMKNCGISFECFDKYSQQSTNYGGTHKLWNSIRNFGKNDSSIGTLYYYASISDGFVPDTISLLTNVQQECVKSILEKGTLTHTTCCKLFHNEYPDYYIYSNSTWYNRLKCGRYSEIEVDTDTILSSHISKFFENFENNVLKNVVSNDTDRKLLLKAKSLTEKYEYKTSIIKELKMYYSEPNLLAKLDSKTHLIGFDNGVYDLLERKFRMATIDDCISWTCGFNYITPEECDSNKLQYLENFIFSLFENKDTGAYFLKHIGSFLFGGNKEELIHFWVGNGRNGKGTVDDLLRETLGPYYHVLDDAFFTTTKKNQDEASPAMMALKNVRLTMTTEPEGGTAYLSSKFKRLCGNDPIHCRSLYSNSMQTFIPTFKPVIQTNHLPQFTDVDMGLLQRIRVINFCYTFVKPTEYDSENKYHKLIDINLKTNLRKLKPEFIILLIKWYDIYCVESLDFPSKDILEVTKSYRADIDSVQTFINSATKVNKGESISTIDLLYNYNGWSKEKMNRNVFAQRLKGNFNIKTVKNNGRLLTCLIDRSWLPDFTQ